MSPIFFKKHGKVLYFLQFSKNQLTSKKYYGIFCLPQLLTRDEQ